ncbi:MAG TPA: Qat anti-phage system TatD family nuclease QatD [Gemmatimonadaceae bacterium]|nr:Qat anti-phage system TatD family nuclease QatD [Gemmatimonadaceae bacterium]
MNQIGDVHGFDFHCHVDLDRDPAALIRRCEKERIVTLAVTTTPRAWPQNREWAAQSRYVLPALGLHPELVAERYAEIALLEACMPEARFIGEIGLDGSAKHRGSLARQQEVFGRTLQAAQRSGARVLTIHSRGAAKEVIDMIEQNTTNDRVFCVLHWFSGTLVDAKRAASLGCCFSVNGQMLDNERGQILVKSLPLNLLLTETDSPFSKQGERNSLPWDVLRTAETLAGLRTLSVQEMTNVLADNARRVIACAGIEVDALAR